MYSGVKTGAVYNVTSLHEMCIRVLQRNIDGEFYFCSVPLRTYFDMPLTENSAGIHRWRAVRYHQAHSGARLARATAHHGALQSVPDRRHRPSVEPALQPQIPRPEAPRVRVVARHVLPVHRRAGESAQPFDQKHQVVANDRGATQADENHVRRFGGEAAARCHQEAGKNTHFIQWRETVREC